MYRPVLFFMIIYAFIGAGCSGTNAVTSDNLPLFSNNDSADFLPVARTGSITYEGIIGAFSVVINTETLTGEVLPLRRAGAIGDSFDSHITEFMNKTPCSDCVKLSGIALSSEHNIKVNFKIRHPFTDLLKRPDLHVFDVRGILLHPGGVSFGMILSDVDGDGNANEIIQTDPDFLLTADGYTTTDCGSCSHVSKNTTPITAFTTGDYYANTTQNKFGNREKLSGKYVLYRITT